MHVLFVCSANKDHSATAEEMAMDLWPTHTYGSAGTNQKLCFQYGTQYINQELINDSDLILVMENKHKKSILKTFGTNHGSKIKVLNIKDHYEYGNAELKEILKEKLAVYL
tara:strand:+ start:677 stop:1009 length:333 start_codon:yes stop_codon:yes gene_type:complete